jgi:hypothetical protein
MATTLEELVLLVRLDHERFGQDERDAVADFKKTKDRFEEYGGAIERQGIHIGKIFSTLKGGAVGLLGAFVGGEAATFIDHIAQMDARLSRLSRSTGVAIENLSLWRGVIRQMGGAASDADTAMQGLQDAIAGFEQGTFMPSGPFASIMNRIGGLRGKTPDQVMRQVIALFDEMVASGEIKREQIPARLQGFPGMTPGMIDTIIAGTKAFNENAAAAEKAGLATKESGDASEGWVKKSSIFVQALERLGATLLPSLTQGLDSITAALGRSAEGWNSWLGRHIVPGGLIDRLIFAGRAAEILQPDKKEIPAVASMGIPAGGVSAAGIKVSPQAGMGSPIAAGIKVSPQAGIESPITHAIVTALGGIPGLREVTAENDEFHQSRGGLHPQGRAVDVAVTDQRKIAEIAEAVREKLAAMGIRANVAIHASANAPGSHLHISVPQSLDAPAGASQAALNSTINNTRGGDRNVNVTSKVDTINVNAPGVTDAAGVARNINAEYQRYMAITMPFNWANN